VVAKFHGGNNRDLPPFIGLADSWQSDVWGAGHMGSSFEPVKGSELAGRLNLPRGIKLDTLADRDGLRKQFDRLSADLDRADTMAQMDQYSRQALDMVRSQSARAAFMVEREPDRVRDAYGRDSLGQKALLARRLVEAGVAFVLVSGAWGYFDHHGDEVKWGGIVKGLKPLLPRIDGVIYALVNDLAARGMLDSTLVLMLGEFGRSPVMTPTAGRGHWANCMSMLLAGGGMPAGQVIGSTDRRGGDIKDGRVSPADLAATVFRFFDIDLGSHWTDARGRPIPIVTEDGKPIQQLIG
jgi:hypothetical protein